MLKGETMDIGERFGSAEDRIKVLEEKIKRLLAELAKIRQTAGSVKEIKISDKGKGKDKT